MEILNPSQIEYFDGVRDLGRKTFSGIPKYGVTICRHTLRWEWMLGRSLDCGQVQRHAISKVRGIAVEHKSALETTAKASLGTEFIGKIEAELKASLGEAITLQESVTETDEFEFHGKDCFTTSISLFQLQSVLHLSCEWKPWIGAQKYWEQQVVINYNKIHQRTEHRDNHLPCGCDPHVGERTDLLEVRAGSLSIIEPFMVHNRQLVFFNLALVVDDDGVRVTPHDEKPWPPRDRPARDWGVDPDEAAEELLDRLSSGTLELPATILPAHLRFLTDVREHDAIQVQFYKPEDHLGTPQE